ncbi:MAG: hypothetical protein O7A67_05865 [SAR324 cluster bacterium]|nr:hypothetical protein [SAR324 cluster bacterium]MCZ6749072.1 hypothetical protein [SAR324 cluster bacterium]
MHFDRHPKHRRFGPQIGVPGRSTFATNIAEDVIYMVDGEIVRHRAEDYLAQRNGALTAEH